MYRPLEELQDDLARGAAVLDEAVVELADAGRAGDIAALLSPRVRLEAALVARVLLEGEEESAALVCRAVGLTLDGYSAVLRMRHRRSRPASADPAAAMIRYLKVERLAPAALAARLGLAGDTFS
ncbi:MAG: hypothetical protein IT538_07855 [Variibacter sp.]|nr:hypothetical protein [Variibacter sp.]